MAKSKKPEQCPAITWEIERRIDPQHESEGLIVTGYARVGGKRRSVTMGFMTFDDDEAVAVVEKSLTPSDVRRCGYGTKLYERMAQEACKRNLWLASDTQRSRYSEGFWRKQVAKGRAECIEEGRGSIPHNMRERGDPEYWPCKRYGLFETCPPTLARRRRRRKKR